MTNLEWFLFVYIILTGAVFIWASRRSQLYAFKIGYMNCILDRMSPLSMEYLKGLASKGDFVNDDFQRVIFYANKKKDTYFLAFHMNGDEWHISSHVDGIMVKSRTVTYRGEFEVYFTEFFRQHGVK